jgi:hypothetical protein
MEIVDGVIADSAEHFQLWDERGRGTGMAVARVRRGKVECIFGQECQPRNRRRDIPQLTPAFLVTKLWQSSPCSHLGTTLLPRSLDQDSLDSMGSMNFLSLLGLLDLSWISPINTFVICESAASLCESASFVFDVELSP